MRKSICLPIIGLLAAIIFFGYLGVLQLNDTHARTVKYEKQIAENAYKPDWNQQAFEYGQLARNGTHPITWCLNAGSPDRWIVESCRAGWTDMDNIFKGTAH